VIGRAQQQAPVAASAGMVTPPAVTRRTVRALIPARRRPQLAGAVRSLRYRGDSVSCPCCGGSFDRFCAHRERPLAKCPRCGSLERHRLLLLFLADRTDILERPLELLHAAPEHALLLTLSRQPNLRYRTVDLDSPLAQDHADLMRLPYPAERFDVVLCSHVLEHVGDDRLALAEIRRVLVPGGRAVLMSPIDERRRETLEDDDVLAPADRARVFGQADHVRRYGRDFAGRVAECDFSVETIPYIDELSVADVRRMGLRRESELFERDDIFVCTVPSDRGEETRGVERSLV
jgi:SAM-dependent methyltransferase